MDQQIESHYGVSDLGERILRALEASGKEMSSLCVDDLAPVDEFHIRGRESTAELAEWVELQASHEVLDVGCGLGGTCRYLADSVGCSVVGIDLTAEYCRVADMLSARVGLSDRTTFQQGSALAIPFDDARFDVVWTEHVQMNVADKTAFYGELTRVLKPGGHLAFHDVFAGDGGTPHFPVPWAGESSISHLVSVDALGRALSDVGLVRVRWEDKTEASIAFFKAALQRLDATGPPPLGLHLLMGDDAKTKFANVLRNLEDERVRVVQAVLRSPSD